MLAGSLESRGHRAACKELLQLFRAWQQSQHSVYGYAGELVRRREERGGVCSNLEKRKSQEDA